MTNDEKQQLLNQVGTDVQLMSVLSVIPIFFIGALLPQFNSYDLSVRIPISFLIVATFAFFFSALILSNTSQKIIAGKMEEAQKYITYGYAISEYMGIFLLVVSVPLAMSIITQDLYIRTITFCAAILGLAVYQFMGFSNLENHFSRKYKLLAVVTVLFGILLFFSQIYAFHFISASIAFLVFIALVTSLAPVKSFQ